ncbi:amidohydrolase family protein [Variovorax sp. RA8]|uniref:amidohydrolase family protein n=1 Tax=Variovorax sp. (strain JCM 16519 / RA8) TaxID=662548 RepID=UPI0013183E98|nr:amidohydrolase family protein [Variovorax sp. RA8]VTU42826.1 Melamine deaminase [Variovorax sp. RA8]
MTRGQILFNATVVSMNPRREIFGDGALAWEGGRIVAVGRSQEVLQQHPEFDRIDGEAGLLAPGFIDAHNHSAHFLTKGLLDDVAVEERWKTRLYPFEQAVSADEAYWGASGTFAEQLLHGTTCVGDPGSAHPHAVARAAEDTGIRLLLAGSTTDSFDAARPLSPEGGSDADAAAARNERLFDELDGAASGRIRVAFGLWSDSTVSDALCKRVRDLAERRQAVIHGHLATREADNLNSLRQHGMRAVPRYHQLGVLGPRFTGAHAGAIDDAEVELLARAGATITHCPSASMLGGFGCIAHGRFPELVAAGVNVALGADAASISRFLDMPRLMYLAACAHKDVRRDATVLGAHAAMEMATLGGAQALGLRDTLGTLEPGKQADFVLLRTDGIEWQPRPLLNPVANLVYSSGGHRVDSVAVAGRLLVRHGRLMSRDFNELMERARTASQSIVSRAGLPEQRTWPVL